MVSPIDLPWDQYTFDVEPRDPISPNFRFYELTRSDTADRLHIDNRLAKLEHLRSAVYLCRNVLQPVRDAFGRFSPNSVFRSQALERALKQKPQSWISSSQHTQGCACDIEIPGMPTIELAKWISENIVYDQIICECYHPGKGPNSGWVHVSLVPPAYGTNRARLLSYVMDKNLEKFVYVDGLVESVA